MMKKEEEGEGKNELCTVNNECDVHVVQASPRIIIQKAETN